MTNIMAIKVGSEHGPESGVYVCSDSQFSNEREKGRAQKLFLRGGNLITSTGRLDRLMESVESLKDLKDGSPPSYVCERVFEHGRKFNFRKPKKGGHQDSQGYIVAGLENDEPTIYSVNISREAYEPDPEFKPIIKMPSYCFKGSGSSQVVPATQRDFETGNMGLVDFVEGLALCFSYGEKAQIDLWVDEKLQIGLITPKFTRLLYHPATNFSIEDAIKHFTLSTGIVFDPKEFTEDHRKGFGNVNTVLNDLYQAFLINCKTMENADRDVNSYNAMSKTDFSKREKYEKNRLLSIEERDSIRGYIKELFDGWVSGDISKIAEAVRTHTKRREERYKSADEFIKRLGDKANPDSTKPSASPSL